MRASALGLKEITVHFGIFDVEMTCLVGPYDNVEKFVAWRFDDEQMKPERQTAARGMFFHHKGCAPIIWIRRRPRSPKEYGALAHEIMHVMCFLISEWAGIQLSRDTDEVYCYALGHAMTSILEKLK